MRLEQLKQSTEKLLSLLNDPHPDLMTWCQMVRARVDEIAGSNWIRVTERLPEAKPGFWSEQVLVLTSADTQVIDLYYHATDGDGFWRNEPDYPGCAKYVAWMPLPPTTMEKGEEER